MFRAFKLRRLLAAPIRLVFGTRTCSVRGEGGVRLRFFPAEAPSLLLGPQRIEPALRQQWRQLLRPNDVIVDVGAHIGITVQRFYALLGGECRIIAIEPLLRSFNLLRQNTQFIAEEKIFLFHCALGERDGTVLFSDNVQHGAISRMAQLSRDQRPGYWDAVRNLEVPVFRIDTLLDRHELPAPTFFKLDVEGAGGLVLDGAARLIAQAKPTFYCEYHGADEQQAVGERLRRAGYRGVSFDRQAKPIWDDSAPAPFYFVHPDHPSAELVRDDGGISSRSW